MVTVTSDSSQNAPTVFPLVPCGSGGSDMVTLGCLATGFRPSSITFSWKKGQTSLENVIQYPSMQKGSDYIGISQVQVSRQDWEARQSFQCVADHSTGQKHASVGKPNVVYEPPTLKVCSSYEERKEEAYFSCFAKDFSPNQYEITWLKDGQEISGRIDEVSTSSRGRNDTNGTTLYSVASLLTLPSKSLNADSKLTCLFTGKGGRNTNATVSYKECDSVVNADCHEKDVAVNIIPPTNEEILLNKKGTITCQVTVFGSGFEKIVWEDEKGEELVSEEKSTNSNTYQAKIEITFDEWTNKDIKRVCVIHNNNWYETMKREYNRNYGGGSKRPSVFMLPPLEQTREKTLVLTCYVKDFYPPEVYVAWLVDDEKASSKYQFKTTEPLENKGLFSVYSQLSLSEKDWEKTDVVYSCAVYHETMANSTRNIVRSIGYRTLERTNVVNLSMNIPDTCKAQ